jgi:hypothetical protein
VALACAAPVLALGAVWLLVTQVLMLPAVPDQSTPADRVAQFIMHPKGLPRLDPGPCEAFLQQQARRLVQDEPFRRRFLAEYRVSSLEEQKAFREHLFDAFKPLVMRDIRTFHELSPPQHRAYLDDRIVAYNRMNSLWGQARIGKSDLGPAAPGPDELLGLLLQKTTEQERQMGMAYAAALQARVSQILADPELKQEFETRIGLPQP